MAQGLSPAAFRPVYGSLGRRRCSARRSRRAMVQANLAALSARFTGPLRLARQGLIFGNPLQSILRLAFGMVYARGSGYTA